jgi:hypothetical protein
MLAQRSRRQITVSKSELLAKGIRKLAKYYSRKVVNTVITITKNGSGLLFTFSSSPDWADTRKTPGTW